MTYDEVQEWYGTVIQISQIFFKDGGSSLQISDSSFILNTGGEHIMITPNTSERTLSMSSRTENFFKDDKIEDIESHEWFNLTILHKVPYSYDCIKKLRTIDKKFHILIGINE